MAALLLAMVAAWSPHATSAEIVVDSLADTDLDDGSCTLREAILSVSLDVDRHGDCGAAGSGWPGQDVIRFAAGLWSMGATETTIALTSPLPELSGSTLISTTGVTGRRFLRLLGAGNHRLMRIVRPANGRASSVRIERVRFEGGVLGAADLPAAGAALSIAAGVSVELEETRFEDNDASAGQGGGAIGVLEDCDSCLRAALGIAHSAFVGNRADGKSGGAVYVVARDNELALTMEDVLLQDNAASTGSALLFVNSARPGVQRAEEVSLRRVRAIDNVLAGAEELATHVGVTLSDRDLQQAGISIVDFLASGNAGSPEPQGHALFAVGQVHPVRLERLAIHHNASGALVAGGLPLSVSQSFFADNVSVAGSYAPVALLPLVSGYVAGNTFLRNRMVPLPFSAGDAHQLAVLSDGAMPSSAIVSGNLFVRAPGVPLAEPQCGVMAGTTVSAHDNVADHAQCALGSGSVHALSLPLAEIPLSGPIHTYAAYPLPGNPALDGWQPLHCVDGVGVPLEDDAAGDPRPIDGDGDGISTCDVGAFESPAGLATGVLFADGFESLP